MKPNMKKALLICLMSVIGFTNSMFAQTSLLGSVTDVNNSAVSGAVVMAMNGSYLKNERNFASVMLDQSVVVDFNKKNSVGVALTGWIKPNEHDNIKGSLSDIENKIALYRGGGTLTYKHVFNGRGSNIEFARDYLHTYDKHNSVYKINNVDIEDNNSVTKKNTGPFKLDGEFVFKDEEMAVSYGLFYL